MGICGFGVSGRMLQLLAIVAPEERGWGPGGGEGDFTLNLMHF